MISSWKISFVKLFVCRFDLVVKSTSSARRGSHLHCTERTICPANRAQVSRSTPVEERRGAAQRPRSVTERVAEHPRVAPWKGCRRSPLGGQGRPRRDLDRRSQSKPPLHTNFTPHTQHKTFKHPDTITARRKDSTASTQQAKRVS